MALILTAVQQVTYSVAFVDAQGNPARVEGAPTWRVSDETILSVTPQPDGLSALVKAEGPVGTAQALVEADADLGGGVSPIQGLDSIEVIAAQAVGIEVKAGTPEDQPLPESEKARRRKPAR